MCVRACLTSNRCIPVQKDTKSLETVFVALQVDGLGKESVFGIHVQVAATEKHVVLCDDRIQ